MQTFKKSVNKNSLHYCKNLIWLGILITVIYTPWFNKDSLAIPKQTILLMTAMYFLPKIIFEISLLSKLIGGKIVLLPIGLILIQLLLVMFFSGAPIEQQIYGRDGRLLGFFTFYSIIILLIVSIRYFNKDNIFLILRGIFISSIPVTVYAVIQSYGIDFFKWESRTNMVISTLGNPNYVAAFTAFAVLPSIAYVHKFKFRYYIQFILFVFSLFTVYRTQSIQGYLAIFFALNVYLLCYIFYRFRKLLIYFIVYLIAGTSIVISGMVGHGPMAKFLYKVSVQSRGDFWRSAWETSVNNPLFGVGLDSFGENYLRYRDEVASNHSFAEFTDSAHNFLLDYAAFGGFLLAILNICLIVLTLYFFVKVLLDSKTFEMKLISIFCAWCALQATLFISPISIASLFWSCITSGALIGIGLRTINSDHKLDDISFVKGNSFNPRIMKTSALVAIFLMMPLINSDRLYLKSLNTSDGNLGIKLVNEFPRSTQKYSTVGRLLHESGQYKYALDVARKSIKFNSKNTPGYALIMINPLASIDERVKAKQILLTLDPFNKEVSSYQILPMSD